MNQWQAIVVGPTLYASGIATIRLLEMGHVFDGVVVFTLAVGLCALSALMAKEI